MKILVERRDSDHHRALPIIHLGLVATPKCGQHTDTWLPRHCVYEILGINDYKDRDNQKCGAEDGETKEGQ